MVLYADAAIADALMTHAGIFGAAASIPVAYPDIPYEPLDGVAYIEASFMPNRSETLAITGGAAKHVGFLQLALMYPSGSGAIPAIDLAGEIIEHFRKGTTLYSNGTKVQINRQPWQAPPLTEPGRIRVPISIPYTSVNFV